MKRKIIILAGIVAMLAGGSVTAYAADAAFNPNVQDLRPYYRKEDVDLGDYDSILLDSLGLDDARVVAPPWIEAEDRGPKKWQLTNGDMKFLRDSYAAAMKEEIEAKGGYPLVTEPGAGVLILDMEIIYLMPYARKGEDVTTRGFGEILVQAQLRDGMTGELLAIYEGKQEVGSEYQQNTRLNAENDLRALFAVWGGRMRTVMDAAHGR